MSNKTASKKVDETVSERTTPVDEKTGLHLRTDSKPPEEDIKNVNPAFSTNAANVTNNCVYASAAFEMRRRGYDVTAGLSKKGMNGPQVTSEMFPGGETKDVDPLGIWKKEFLESNEAKVNQRVRANPLFQNYSAKASMGENREYAKNVVSAMTAEKNQRGSMFVTWAYGMGGHAVSYEVKGGKLTIFDPQSGIVYNGAEAEDFLSNTISTLYYRTDDKDFDLAKVKEAMR